VGEHTLPTPENLGAIGAGINNDGIGVVRSMASLII